MPPCASPHHTWGRTLPRTGAACLNFAFSFCSLLLCDISLVMVRAMVPAPSKPQVMPSSEHIQSGGCPGRSTLRPWHSRACAEGPQAGFSVFGTIRVRAVGFVVTGGC